MSPIRFVPLILAAAQVWLAASDVHLNTYDRAPQPAIFGADTNLALFTSSVAAMRRAVPDPPVVLVPGDFFMHRFPHPADRGRAIARISADYARAFPRAQFVIALGNNDSACGDYRSELGGPDLVAMARAWAPLVNRDGHAPDFAKTFASSGHYVANSPQPNLRFVVVNSVVFSSLYRGDCITNNDTAAREIDWLTRTLAATPHGIDNVVVMHVAPGYDVFATALAHGFVPWTLMRRNMNATIVRLLADPRNRVVFVVAGHQHHFDVRVAGDVPIVLLGSISPVYGNAPAFYALTVGDTGSIQNVQTWGFDEPSQQWAGPFDFDLTWGSTRLDAEAIRAIHDRLGADEALRARWQRAFDGWAYSRSASLWEDKRWRIAWCAQTELGTGYVQCAQLGRRQTAFWIALAALATVFIASVAGIVSWFRRRMARS